MIWRPMPIGLWATLAAGSVYVALLNNFLRFQQYALLRLEVFYAIVAGLAVAGLFGVIYQAAGCAGKRTTRVIRAILVAALIAYAVGLLTGGHTKVAAVASFLVALLAGEKLLRPIAIMSLVALLAGSLGIGQQRQEQFAQTGTRNGRLVAKPAIVHVVLDDHIGVEGFPSTDPDASKMKELLQSFYTKQGFRLFGGAYSRYVMTMRSIPRILNFGNANDAKSNAYFNGLKQAGYRINVIQSDYIDYCSALVDRCTTYHAQNLVPVAESPLSAGQKATLIGRMMIPKPAVEGIFKASLWLKKSDYDGPTAIRLKALSPVALNGLAALEHLNHDMADLRPGEFYFAHILLPHDPFVLRADCAVEPISRWVEEGAGASLPERLHAYDQQTLCALRAMAGVLRVIERSPAGRNAIVIVHGDHGSRISEVPPMAENIGKFGADTLVAAYSTLFAVRAPGVRPGYDERHYPVAGLLQELVASDWRRTGIEPVERPSVIIIDNKLVAHRRQELPPW